MSNKFLADISSSNEGAPNDNLRILNQLPWLWATRDRWKRSTRVVVACGDAPSFLDTPIKSDRSAIVECYVHMVSPEEELTYSFVIANNCSTIFDALQQLERDSAALMQVQHIATHVRTTTNVFATEPSTSFASLYRNHPRRMRDA